MSKMENKVPWMKWLLLAAVTLLFLFFPFLLNEFHHPAVGPGMPQPPPEHEIPFPFLNRHREELQNLLLIVFFYLNYGWLIPRFLIRKNPVQYVLAAAVSLLGFIMLVWAINYGMDRLNHMIPLSLLQRFPGLLLSYVIAVGIAVGVGLYEDWRKTQQEKKELQQAALESELSFLKSQVSPHFLFNTLNNIYALAVTQSEQTPDAILKLSGLMRYMLHEANERTVALEKELHYLDDFIALQRMRLTEKVKIDYSVLGNADGMTIHPLLLIPFIENAFKHGVSYAEGSAITIRIQLTKAQLKLEVVNPVTGMSLEHKDKSSGVGLVNVKKRLAILYPDRHALEVRNDGKTYSVSLILDLQPV